jgi:hypothetical protein
MVTDAAGGRHKVTRSGVSLDAGMDTFIWRSQPPFSRPAGAWHNQAFPLPYTREQWLAVFPDGTRRLLTEAELAPLGRP